MRPFGCRELRPSVSAFAKAAVFARHLRSSSSALSARFNCDPSCAAALPWLATVSMAFWLVVSDHLPEHADHHRRHHRVPFAVAKTLSAFGMCSRCFAGAVTVAPARLPERRPSTDAAERSRTALAAAPEALVSGPRSGTAPAWSCAGWPWRLIAGGVPATLSFPDALIVSLFSDDAGASIPLAVAVGAPMYLDGYAALPLVRGLMEKGMGSRRSPSR